MIGDVCSTELGEGNSVFQPLLAERFWIIAMKACSNRYQHGYGIGSGHMDSVRIWRDGAAVEDHAGANPESNAVMAAAVHALVCMPVEDEHVAGSCDRARQRDLTKTHSESDEAGFAAGEAEGEEVVWVRGQNLSGEDGVATAEADAGDGGIEIEGAAVFRRIA